MKKVILLTYLSVLLLASCSISTDKFVHDKTAPSSNIVEKEYKFSAFDQVDVSVISNVTLVQAQEGDYRVVLSAPENYVELLSLNVDDKELEIKFTKRNTNIEGKIDITVYAPALRKIENSGVANVTTSQLSVPKLEVENSGVGTINLTGLTVGELEVECSGVGNVELKGTAEKAEYECSGVGSIKAGALQAKSVEAEVSGVGGIQCHASEEIRGEVSGVGSLKYGGNPAKKSLHRSGVGKVSVL